MSSTLIIAVVAGFVLLFVIGIYNRLVALRQECKNAFADVDVYLKQRFDLIPNLVETVKGYATHEKSLFEDIAKARAGITSSANIADRVTAENQLTTGMRGLYAVMENYPALKADQNFARLMSELSDLENKVSAARRFFNNAVGEYNASIQQVPAALFAPAMGFKSEPMFDLGDAARAELSTAPKVSF
ncbi:MAG: LemA family protein [Alphaproteobacteria bacterium]|nr:LemA family protein [Alphaproteobacteria bacterium]